MLTAQKDHPRIRGEHFIKYGIVPSSEGSSPHTRGARRRLAGRRRLLGIIPAYAGSTTKTFSPPRAARDHPRIRGEHWQHRRRPEGRRGSSPHTRGARMGGVGGRFLAVDHPRIRGEHVYQVLAVPGDAGSSPHTRGAPAGAGDDRPRCRIIPAYAGSTRTASCL